MLGARFRRLVEQGYMLADPFAGIKVRGGKTASALSASRAPTSANLIRPMRIPLYPRERQRPETRHGKT
ncbi:hypothetical protein BZM26_00145 [Paraburkholderia strydomiana]|nr:hypothetical protein BZM26_00145 [Paraburkholderia strydomiana]